MGIVSEWQCEKKYWTVSKRLHGNRSWHAICISDSVVSRRRQFLKLFPFHSDGNVHLEDRYTTWGKREGKSKWTIHKHFYSRQNLSQMCFCLLAFLNPFYGPLLLLLFPSSSHDYHDYLMIVMTISFPKQATQSRVELCKQKWKEGRAHSRKKHRQSNYVCLTLKRILKDVSLMNDLSAHSSMTNTLSLFVTKTTQFISKYGRCE